MGALGIRVEQASAFPAALAQALAAGRPGHYRRRHRHRGVGTDGCDLAKEVKHFTPPARARARQHFFEIVERVEARLRGDVRGHDDVGKLQKLVVVAAGVS